MKAYSKKQFDPFCRRERIVFEPLDKTLTEGFVTTIGQLNFFRWALQNGVLEYAKTNLNEIEKDMVSSLKNRYEYIPSKNKKRSESFDGKLNIVDESKVIKTSRKKRNELSKSASKTLTRIDGVVKISFS